MASKSDSKTNNRKKDQKKEAAKNLSKLQLESKPKDAELLKKENKPKSIEELHAEEEQKIAPEFEGMLKLFLCGRSEAGKTTLTQALKRENIRYQKTQYTKTWDITIDTPGEYLETKDLGYALGCFSFDSDIVGLLCAADEPYNLFDPAIPGVCNRPMIGIITKIDSPNANVPMVEQWLEYAGCERVFPVNNLTGEGVDELRDYLYKTKCKLTVEEAMRKQTLGLRDWDDPDNIKPKPSVQPTKL